MKTTHLIISVLIAALVTGGLLGQHWLATAGAAESQGSRPSPVFEIDPAWPQVPAKWKLGGISSMAVDDKDNVWVLTRPRTVPAEQSAMAAPPVIVFDAAGKFLQAWGGEGSGYDWPEREHGIHIDHKGYVWIGGNHCAEDIRDNERGIKPLGDDAVLKFTQAGKLVMQIGKSNQSAGNADTRNLRQPADAFVYPKTNELFVADGYGNHRVAVFDADTGVFKRMWGAFANKPVDNTPCPPSYPASVTDGDGPEQFSTPHAIRVSNDGLVYVADREYRRVQVFTFDGKFVKQLRLTRERFALNLALSADPEQQFLYVGSASGIVIVDRKTLEVVSNFHTPGILTSHHITTDSRGNLYIASPAGGMQKLAFKGLAHR